MMFLSVGFSTLMGGLFFTKVRYSDEYGLYYKYKLGYVEITDAEDRYSITIPEKINGLKVKSIGEDAFYNCDSLTSIVIPNSVKSIGDYAFRYCESLTSIVIPNSVTSIGDYAFRYCESLTSIVIPNSVTSIGDCAFSSCSSLTIYCEASYQPSGWYSSWNSSRPVYWGITSEDIIEQNGIQYVILNGEATITRYEGNDSEVVIPSSIEINGTTYNVISIGKYAFSGCSSLTSIVIPNSVRTIEFYAFYGCSSLESITLPFVGQYADGSGATHFGYIFGASSYYSNSSYVPSSLKEVIITGGTRIVSDAFYDCDSLTSITIPNSVTSIGERAFYYCSSLTIVTFEEGSQLTSIGVSAFSWCGSLTTVTFEEGSQLTSIGDSAFYNCSSLTSIVIPNSVTSIGEYAFSYCSSLTIYCEASSKPSGWSSYWNSSDCEVVWGYK